MLQISDFGGWGWDKDLLAGSEVNIFLLLVQHTLEGCESTEMENVNFGVSLGGCVI